MSTVTKYWEKYKERHRGESAEKSDLSKLTTDKQAYISFLEVNLERVTQSVLTTQGFSDRIESLQSQLTSSDEKLLNLTRLVKLQQTFAESQEEEINSLKKLLESGPELKTLASHSLPSNLSSFERRLKAVEEKLESPKSERGKFDDFVKEIDAALKGTESKISDLVNSVTFEIETKQKRFHKYIEETLEKYSKEFEDNYEELSKKVYGRAENDWARIGKDEKSFDGDTVDRVKFVENGLKDLEKFLVAIAEEVKKIDERQKDTTEIEDRVSSKVNHKIQRLSDLVKKSMSWKKENGKSGKSPEVKQEFNTYHFKNESYSKESHSNHSNHSNLPKESRFKDSPNFPEVSPTQSQNNSRSRSKESKASRERSKSPQFPSKPKPNLDPRRSRLPKEKTVNNSSTLSKPSKPSKLSKLSKPSKSPKSCTSRSKKSNSSSRTPVSRSSSRTPKSKRSVSPSPSRNLNKSRDLSPSDTPKPTTKSKAMEASIREKIQKMRQKDNEEKKILMKKDEKRKTKKSSETRSKLDKLYREL